MICVRDVLRHKPAGVWTVGPQDSVYAALELMADKDIGAVPVVQDGQIVGMFSERDYARRGILKGHTSRETKVSELMTSPVYWVVPSETIEYCMQMMTERRFRHLPVLENGELLGIVSIGDIMKALVNDQQSYIFAMESYITGGRG